MEISTFSTPLASTLAARVAALPPDPVMDQIRAEVAHEQEVGTA